MSAADFFVTFCMGPIALTVLGVVMYALGRRDQRRYFAEHPELPDPFERQPRHTPAE